MPDHHPSVEIIIPHARGFQMLERCLDSLGKSSCTALSICIVDNASGEEKQLAGLQKKYKQLRLVSHAFNKGYSGGCNSGLFSSSAKYVVFLNDDATVDPLCIARLVDAAEADETIAALQPKILSLQARRAGKKVFDYAGAAGGLIDRLGYPYCYGRTFLHIENDSGQYDSRRNIFWASGVALFARRDVVTETGGFDEDFFMHMEEIDLCWRILLKGYRIVSVPSAVVYHEGASTLPAHSPEKIFLNHRNNIAMVLKNRSAVALLPVLPLRLLFECAAAVRYLAADGQGAKKAAGILRALWQNLVQLPHTLRKRKEVQKTRCVTDAVLFGHSPLTILFSRTAPLGNRTGV